MTLRFIFPLSISFILFFLCSPKISCQETKQDIFFKKIYGLEYENAVKSLSNNDKISFSKKVLKDIDTIEKKSYQRHTILKVLPLVNNYKSGYPTAVALLQKLINKNNDRIKLKFLSQLCDLKNLLAKSIPTSKKNDKTEAFCELLKSQILLAKLHFNANHFKESSIILKASQQTARTLKIKKAINNIKEIMGVLTSKLSTERLYHQKLNQIKNNVNEQESLDWIGGHILNEFGDITLATPYILKAQKGNHYNFIQMYRNYLASNLKASKAPLFFSDNDLDLPNNLLLEYLTVSKETSAKALDLQKAPLTERKETILKALTLGENLIDSGEKVLFNQHAELAQKFMLIIKSIKSQNARLHLISILEVIIKKSFFSDLKLDDAQKTIFKILLKDIKELKTATLQHIDFISFDSIPTNVKKPATKDLKQNEFIVQGLIVKGVKNLKGFDVTNPKNAKKYSKLFHLPAEIKKEGVSNSWSVINVKDNNNEFQFKCQEGKGTLFHTYLISKKAQSLKFEILSVNLGNISIFLNGKLMKVNKKADTNSFEAKLIKKQYMLRIVFFHQDRSNDGHFKISIKPSKENQKIELKTSNLSQN
ncbi:MAG: hypothetical protein COA79_02240 [Planctomycetota bacterium]|nr:MAG: hypothetical protein COA79_02240 [Planctomycetota bacterium]